MKKTKWSFGLVQRTFFLMLFVFIIILGLMSLQGITEYKERLISSTYDASLTSGLQSIYQTEYSLDNKNMTKYLKNYYLTNEGMSAIVDSDNNIKSFVSSASLHVSQLWILDENKSQEIMVDISENNLVLNCKMKLELRNWDKGACPFIPIRVAAGPYSQFL